MQLNLLRHPPTLPVPLIDPTREDEHDDESDLDLWHLDAIGLTATRAEGFGNKGTGVGVAVLDTGIAEVPEIRGRVKASYSLDPTGGWTRVHTHDTNGHGTHVAGLVAGSRVGVAPGVDLTNVIMIPNGKGMLSDFVSALEFVAGNPEISILNMSAGIPGYRPGMRSAVEAKDGTPAAVPETIAMCCRWGRRPRTTGSPVSPVGVQWLSTTRAT